MKVEKKDMFNIVFPALEKNVINLESLFSLKGLGGDDEFNATVDTLIAQYEALVDTFEKIKDAI